MSENKPKIGGLRITGKCVACPICGKRLCIEAKRQLYILKNNDGTEVGYMHRKCMKLFEERQKLAKLLHDKMDIKPNEAGELMMTPKEVQ
jgi:hypothetical protein